MLSVFDALGIDPDELTWQDYAICRGLDTNWYYDEYESDEQVAQSVDAGCSSCPVRLQCLRQGIENKEWGVWGGLYLTAGRPDPDRNKHKSPEDWKEIREVIGATESLH